MAKKVLIVDDHEDLRVTLREFLEGYEVLEAGDGETALRILRRGNEIGLVILDVMMPGISGLDVLVEIRKMTPSPKVIILTGHSSKDVAIEALRAHADDYIEKPINIARLQGAVQKLMAAENGEPEPDSLDLAGKIAKVKKFVEVNCCKKVNLADAADTVFLSPKYLSRVFRLHARCGFNEYKLKCKVEKAKELLVKYGYTINQIADKLGYENPESFIRQFKKIVGSTPTEYRNKKKKVSRRGAVHGRTK